VEELFLALKELQVSYLLHTVTNIACWLCYFWAKITNNLKKQHKSAEEGIEISGEINARYLCVYVHTLSLVWKKWQHYVCI